MSEGLCFAVECLVKYETPNENGETRSERNAAFGREELTPDWDIPDDGLYLWNWYWSVSKRNRRVFDGVAQPLAWSEFIAWQSASGEIVTPFEYDILTAMDDVFVSTANAEIEAQRATAQDRSENAGKPVTGKRG